MFTLNDPFTRRSLSRVSTRMPYSRRTGYGGTKRGRSTGYGGTSKRRRTGWESKRSQRRRLARGKKRYSKRLAPLYRAPRLGLGQPARIFVKHTNVMSISASNGLNAFSGTQCTFFPLNLRDIEFSRTASRPFPENSPDYARMYTNYRVHGVKIKAFFADLDVNANRAFISCFYSVPGPNDGSTPADPFTINTALTADKFLQIKQIRKHRIVGTGVNNDASMTTHHAGYWAMKRIQSDTTMDAHVAEGEVDATMGAINDPELRPIIIHKTIAQDIGGWPAAKAYTIRYKITFYVEWFARRRSLEDTRTEA